MSTAHAAASQLFNVTFYNELAGRRGMLIDNVTEAIADAVVARCSDKTAPQFYLQAVRKEASLTAAQGE
jgi:hypothetical protein